MIQDFTKNSKGLTRNPLGIIALFISLIYGFACLVLSTSLSNLIENTERLPLIWFIIGFPILILVSFILLVIFHHEKLYAPIDYKDEKNFVSTFQGRNFRLLNVENIEVTKDTEKNKKNFEQLVLKSENPNYNKELFPKEAKPNLNLANQFIDKVRIYTEDKVKQGYITGFGFGIQAPEYFLTSYFIPEKFLKQKGRNFTDTVIIRVTENENGELTLIAIGKDIQETSVDKFAKKFSEYIDEVMNKVIDKEEVGNN
jgi:ABC-type transport system involved in multi-copper enzyme maturation permease subunit